MMMMIIIMIIIIIMTNKKFWWPMNSHTDSKNLMTSREKQKVQ